MSDRPPKLRLVPAEKNEDCAPDLAVSLSVETIFRKLIEDEIRAGRLDSARRRRIVRYAAQLRLSAVEAGRLIEECRVRVLQSEDEAEREHALRLIELPQPQSAWRNSIFARFAIVVVVAILMNWARSAWFR